MARGASSHAAAAAAVDTRPTRGKTPAATRSRQRTGALTPDDIAWLAAVPCACVVVLTIVLLGQPLGSLLFPESAMTFYPSVGGLLMPEPTEQARFLIALAGPMLLTLAIVLGVRRAPRIDPIAGSWLVGAAQFTVLGFVAVCFAAQWSTQYGPLYTASGGTARVVYFTAASIAAAALAAALIAWAGRNAGIRHRLAEWTAESPTRTAIGAIAAAVLAAIWLLPAINFDDTIVNAHISVAYHTQFGLDEAFAVLDGRTPLGDFAAQYGSLWPFATAGGMSIFGETTGVYTILMACISGVAMLAAYDTLRRLTSRSLVALTLFVPFMATSFYMMRGPLENRYAVSNLFGAFPLRYAGPLILAWFVVRHLSGARPRRAWPVFLVAGLVTLNNAEFGVPALGATIAALVWAGGRPTRTSLRQLALQALLGLAGACLLVTLLVAVRTGEPPDFSLLLRYSRLFAVAGFGMLPIGSTLGFHLVIYVTFVAAIALATVRALVRSEQRALTGMLVWSGIFGLGASSYFIGRSHPEVLINLFCAWALTVTLLTIAAARALPTARTAREIAPIVAVLFGFGLTICSIAQVPTPWSQLDRLQDKGEPAYQELAGQSFVARETEPGEPVAILMLLGHRMATALGIDSVTPYSGDESMPTVEQLRETLDRLREAGGRKVFVAEQTRWPELPNQLMREGFQPRSQDAPSGVTLWVPRDG